MARNLIAPLRRRWDDRFALDFAMTLEGSGVPPEKLLKEYGFTPADLAAFSQEPLFIKKVETLQNQLKERGFTFKFKAQMQAEDLLDTSWDIIHDHEVSPAVKADLIKWTAKVAGLEPTKETVTDNQGVKINIIMGDVSQPVPAGMRSIDSV